LVVVETFIIAASFLGTQALRLRSWLEGVLEDGWIDWKVAVAVISIQASLYYHDLYERRAPGRRSELFIRLGRAIFSGAVLLSLVSYAFPIIHIDRGVLLGFGPVVFCTLLLWRRMYLWIDSQKKFSERVLILGTGVEAQQIAIEALSRLPLGFHIVGFLGESRAEVGRALVNTAIIGTTQDLVASVEKQKISRIVVALDDRRGRLPVDELLSCRLRGVRVEEGFDFFERLTGRLPVASLRPSSLVFSDGFRKPRALHAAKRTVEVLFAGLGLVVTMPLLAIIAIVIRLDSRGSVLYFQERIGEGGEIFSVIKYRTMRIDAEAGSGPVWATTGEDPRVTAVGRWLRRLRLDELPQLWNVLRGEMSFVGPRPERSHFVEQLRRVVPYYDERHRVKPGITGWAQVKFRYGSTIEDAEEKLQYDLYYVKHMSLMFDIVILLETAKVMILGKGAR